MTSVALKGLAGRKVRALLTALAIVLGVAMVSGSFVLTDTISKAFDTIFASSYRGTDAVISGKKLVDYSNGGNATVPARVLDRVRALPEVAAATGAIMDLQGDSTRAKLLDRDGKAIDSGGNPTFGRARGSPRSSASRGCPSARRRRGRLGAARGRVRSRRAAAGRPRALRADVVRARRGRRVR